MNSLLLIATLIIVIWLAMILLYFWVARQQPGLRRQIEALEQQLDERDGRSAADAKS